MPFKSSECTSFPSEDESSTHTIANFVPVYGVPTFRVFLLVRRIDGAAFLAVAGNNNKKKIIKLRLTN